MATAHFEGVDTSLGGAQQTFSTISSRLAVDWPTAHSLEPLRPSSSRHWQWRCGSLGGVLVAERLTRSKHLV